MGRPTKNDKIRIEALKRLDKVKSKLHPATYIAYNHKIREKRIDAVNRISFELNDLGKVKTCTKLSLSQAKAEIIQNQRSHVNKLQQCLKERYSYKSKVNSFNKSGLPTTIDCATRRILKGVFQAIDTTKRTIVQVGTIFYTMTPDKQKDLLETIDDFYLEYDEENVSDPKYNILRTLEVGCITLSRPKWMGKNKLEGAFCKFYHNTSLDLDQFGIHREKQEEYTENCFVQALIALNVDQEKVAEIRKMICTKYLPTYKLPIIAKKFNLYIRVKLMNSSHKNTRNFGKKCDQEILLGLIDQHYFAVKKVPWTSCAVDAYFDICDKKDFKILYRNGKKLSRDK